MAAPDVQTVEDGRFLRCRERLFIVRLDVGDKLILLWQRLLHLGKKVNNQH